VVREVEEGIMADVNGLSYSANGLALTQQFEGLRLDAYQDSAGVWTIGYGHTGSDVHSGLAISEEQAGDLLVTDVASAVSSVNRLVTVSLTQNQFDTLVDFVFDVGSGNFASSTLLRELNAGNAALAVEQFVRWDHAHGVVVRGLLRRRLAEAQLFQAEDVVAATA
jgi:lysozyme